MPSDDASKRSLVELEILHTELQPELRDLYVEGRRDQHFFSWYLRQSGIKVSGLYTIDDRAEIGSQLVLDAGGEVGPRGRLLALAREVETWQLEGSPITCVIDADRDHLTNEFPSYGPLLRTDYASLEVYLFSPGPLGKLLDLCLERHDAAEDVMESLAAPLNSLFLVRAALHIYGPEVPLVSKFMNCCERRNGAWQVDVAELVNRSLSAAGASRQRERVLAKLEELREGMPDDPLQAVRGHDIAPMLARALNLSGDLAKPEVLERMWRGCVTVDDLDELPLFRALRERLT